ncbi:unnamed protein product [marine sediment metagenome]|uniref:Uncharacterized protein n=1 Tax=marine sediment metagenome TaxID=412755 RepID=X0SS23_9ZZZZ
MDIPITDEDIRTFIRKNWINYPSQISLMQATIRLLWPGGPPTLGNERVVRVCLEENQNHPVVS